MPVEKPRTGTINIIFDRIGIPMRTYFHVTGRDYEHLAQCVGQDSVLRFDSSESRVVIDMSHVVALEFARDEE